MKRLLLAGAVIFSTVLLTSAAEEKDAKAEQLAKDVWQASGGDNWGKIKKLQFTFIVEDNGKELARASHDWKVVDETDHVTWKDKDVTVNLAAPEQTADGKAAFARWTNDSYWLLAPLKLLDRGLKLVYEGPKDCNGTACETLRVSFDKVGLTSGDEYLLYIDPQTKLVRAWDYTPKPGTTMHGTWDKYETFGGLKLSTSHDFAGRTIRFADVKAVTE
ncbi:MAG: hypothetical protein ACR2NX_16150 [Chthoniobacterales bacterium]